MLTLCLRETVKTPIFFKMFYLFYLSFYNFTLFCFSLQKISIWLIHILAIRPLYLIINLWWLSLSLSITAELHLGHIFEHVFVSVSVGGCVYVCLATLYYSWLFAMRETVLKMSLRFWLSLHLNGLLCKCTMGCELKWLLNGEIADCMCMWGAVVNTVYI